MITKVQPLLECADVILRTVLPTYNMTVMTLGSWPKIGIEFKNTNQNFTRLIQW